MRINTKLLVPLALLKEASSLDFSQCSKGGGSAVTCDVPSTCNAESISACEVTCENADSWSGTCDETRFEKSSVTCVDTGYSVCDSAVFNQSMVILEGDAECAYCEFWFSAVTTSGTFPAAGSYNEAVFSFCSCCDDSSSGSSCPPGVPSCTADTVGFCSQEYHLRTCKDWGNPVCEGLEIPSVPAKTSAATCSAGAETVYCEGWSGVESCDSTTLTNCTTICMDSACGSSIHEDGVVGCYDDNTCDSSVFQRTVVDISGTDCSSCEFWFSAVETDTAFPAADSWSQATFRFCSCCDDSTGGSNCPGVPSCKEDTLGFCSQVRNFRTCQDWGNPICQGLTGVTSVPSKTSAATCSEGVDTVYCSGYSGVESCDETTMANCTVICTDSSCGSMVQENAVVGCYDDGTCDSATFRGSFVDISGADCGDCIFWFSAVQTDTPFPTPGAYNEALFRFCSCCDDSAGGTSCPDGVPSCTQDPVGFCSEEHHFRTCQDWGNPACEGLDVTPVPAKTNAEFCSEGLETVYCSGFSGIESCADTTLTNCTVICTDSSCRDTLHENNVVGCYDGNTCDSSTFNYSFVDIFGSDCGDCTFWFSAVQTDTPFPVAGSYDEAVFRFCSCCDDSAGGTICPEGVPSCTQNTTAFCSEEHMFRTCKDWGNPICKDIPNIQPVPAKTSSQSCSQGVDTVYCRDYSGLDSCDSLATSNCTVVCTDRSCASTTHEHGVVGCYDDSTCSRATFRYSYVDLSQTECTYCNFWFSVVTTDSPFPVPGSYNEAVFWFCSCCDSSQGACPEGVPSCEDNTEEFCATQHHLRTCQEWGNPICEGLDLAPGPSKTNAATCSEGVDTVFCESYTGVESCDEKAFRNCTTICVDDSCGETFHEYSNVGCYGSSTCGSSTFRRSRVELADSTCSSCTFHFSAVRTDGPWSDWSSSQPTFGLCSCCDDVSGGGNCPDGVPSCLDDTQGFCSTVQLGQTCKDWGNPICDDLDEMFTFVGANATNATIVVVDEVVTFTNETTCSLPGDDILCEGTDCVGLEATGCTLECYGETCGSGRFDRSAAACLGSETCGTSRFYQSMVDCSNSQCDTSDMFSGSLVCGSTPEDAYSWDFTCQSVTATRCTCCDGDDCPPSISSCNMDPEEFCSQTWLGRTCNDWGHPMCDDIDVPTPEQDHPAATCSLGEDVFICDESENGCLDLESDDCTVVCWGEVCNQARFTDSSVLCYDRPVIGWTTVTSGDACISARFERSIVGCTYSCIGATFVDSFVICSDPGCPGATFNDCSCCDGEGCPVGVPQCEGNMDAICGRVVGGKTCACRGMPTCSEEFTSQCPESTTASLVNSIVSVRSGATSSIVKSVLAAPKPPLKKEKTSP